jgi:hypothetical protein
MRRARYGVCTIRFAYWVASCVVVAGHNIEAASEDKAVSASLCERRFCGR